MFNQLNSVITQFGWSPTCEEDLKAMREKAGLVDDDDDEDEEDEEDENGGNESIEEKEKKAVKTYIPWHGWGETHTAIIQRSAFGDRDIKIGNIYMYRLGTDSSAEHEDLLDFTPLALERMHYHHKKRSGEEGDIREWGEWNYHLHPETEERMITNKEVFCESERVKGMLPYRIIEDFENWGGMKRDGYKNPRYWPGDVLVMAAAEDIIRVYK